MFLIFVFFVGVYYIWGMKHYDFMRLAIDLATDNVENGGGPFGVVVVKDGAVVATGVNRVTSQNDPTAHAEVSAIREACAKLGTFNLQGCLLYTSCEPCPMCLAAIYWAHIDAVYYGANKDDAADAGFDDSFLYNELLLPHDKRNKPINEILPDEARKPFDKWKESPDKVEY